MAIPVIKATYTLDVDTARALEQMARRLGVSKSEALRRAVRAAAQQSTSAGEEALDSLQQSLRLSPAKARGWSRRVRAERRASSEGAEELQR